MAFWKSSNANAKSTGIGVRSAVVEFTNAFDQINRVRKITCGISGKRRVPPQCQNIGNTALRILGENIFNITARVVGACEMWNWIQLSLGLQANNKFMRARSRAATGAIGNANE